jgi:hypothetical protein
MGCLLGDGDGVGMGVVLRLGEGDGVGVGWETIFGALGMTFGGGLGTSGVGSGDMGGGWIATTSGWVGGGLFSVRCTEGGRRLSSLLVSSTTFTVPPLGRVGDGVRFQRRVTAIATWNSKEATIATASGKRDGKFC